MKWYLPVIWVALYFYCTVLGYTIFTGDLQILQSVKSAGIIWYYLYPPCWFSVSWLSMPPKDPLGSMAVFITMLCPVSRGPMTNRANINNYARTIGINQDCPSQLWHRITGFISHLWHTGREAFFSKQCHSGRNSLHVLGSIPTTQILMTEGTKELFTKLLG